MAVLAVRGVGAAVACAALALAAALLSAAAGARAQQAQVEPVLSGFDYAWQRSVAGFETPHRLGSFSNALSVNASGTFANLTFVPGVDGDYAHPSVRVGALSFASDALLVDHERGVVHFEMDDVLDNSTSAPTALAYAHFAVQFIGSDYDSVLPLLNGINVDMHCVKQAPSDVCESDGVWPVRLNVTFDGCRRIGMGPYFSCEGDFELLRGWTPTHGGGKPVNTRMHYDARVSYLLLGSGSPMAHLFTLSQATTIHSAPKPVVHTVALGNPHAAFLAASTGFSFELIETDGEANRGRYLERLAFDLQAQASKSTPGAVDVTWTATYGSPATVLPSRVWLEQAVALLEVTPDWDTAVVQPRTTSGTVCFDDPASHDLFDCAKLGLPRSTTDVVAVPTASGVAPPRAAVVVRADA